MGEIDWPELDLDGGVICSVHQREGEHSLGEILSRYLVDLARADSLSSLQSRPFSINDSFTAADSGPSVKTHLLPSPHFSQHTYPSPTLSSPSSSSSTCPPTLSPPRTPSPSCSSTVPITHTPPTPVPPRAAPLPLTPPLPPPPQTSFLIHP